VGVKKRKKLIKRTLSKKGGPIRKGYERENIMVLVLWKDSPKEKNCQKKYAAKRGCLTRGSALLLDREKDT